MVGALFALANIAPRPRLPEVLELSFPPKKEPKPLKELDNLDDGVKGAGADLTASVKAFGATSFIESLNVEGGRTGAGGGADCGPIMREAGSLAVSGTITSDEPSGEPELKALTPGSYKFGPAESDPFLSPKPGVSKLSEEGLVIKNSATGAITRMLSPRPTKAMSFLERFLSLSIKVEEVFPRLPIEKAFVFLAKELTPIAGFSFSSLLLKFIKPP